LREKRVLILVAQHQFVNSINVGGRSRCTCYRSSLFQTLSKVVQRTFLSSLQFFK